MATHSPTLSKTDDMVLPTPTDTPSAIAAAMHAVNTRANTGTYTHTHTYANTFNLQRDAVRTYKVAAGQADCLDVGAASSDGQPGQTDVMEVTGG